MECKACQDRGKTWEGSDPKCAFVGDFSDNWNCATVNLIRDIVYEGQALPDGIQYQYCQDQKYATVNIFDVGDIGALALFVSWYKSRGRTDAMYLLFDRDPPRIPTEEELLTIHRFYCPQPTVESPPN